MLIGINIRDIDSYKFLRHLFHLACKLIIQFFEIRFILILVLAFVFGLDVLVKALICFIGFVAKASKGFLISILVCNHYTYIDSITQGDIYIPLSSLSHYFCYYILIINTTLIS